MVQYLHFRIQEFLLNKGNIPGYHNKKGQTPIATHMWLRSCLATIQTQGLQRFSTTRLHHSCKKPHTQSSRKQKMWTISWSISQLQKNVKSPPCFSSKMSCVPCPRPRGPRAQRPIEASSSSEESAPVKVTVCGAQRCWKRSKVLGQTRTWQAPKRMDVGQIFPEQWQIV